MANSCASSMLSMMYWLIHGSAHCNKRTESRQSTSHPIPVIGVRSANRAREMISRGSIGVDNGLSASGRRSRESRRCVSIQKGKVCLADHDPIVAVASWQRALKAAVGTVGDRDLIWSDPLFWAILSFGAAHSVSVATQSCVPRPARHRRLAQVWACSMLGSISLSLRAS